jgi:GTPase SAR1 family protein
MTQLHDHASSDDLAKLLVGNKSDLEASREVSQEKAQQFCQEYGMEMLETSAKSGDNVLPAFEKLIGIVHDRALAASKNKGGIKGINAAGTGAGSTNGAGGGTVRLEDQNDANTGNDAAANACGC